MFKLVARAQILVAQGSEVKDGGTRLGVEKMQQGLQQRKYCGGAGS